MPRGPAPGGNDGNGGGDGFTFDPSPSDTPGTGGDPTPSPSPTSSPSTGPSEAEREADANNRSAFANLLDQYGIPKSPQMEQLIKEAINKGYSLDRFLFYLRQTRDYHQTFPGIFENNGSLKMSEAEYIAQQKTYQANAYSAGVNLTQKKMGWLFTNDISPDEYLDKATAFRRIKDDPILFNQFKAALVQEGAAKPGNVTDENLMRFMLGESNAEWYSVWNLARARYVAVEAGISLKQGTDRYLALNPGLIEKISNKGFSDEQLAAGFGQVATGLGAAPGQEGAVLTLSEASMWGVTKRDIVTAQFGGPQAQAAKNRIAKAQAEYEAFNSGRASQQVVQKEGGGYQVLGSDGGRAQSG